MNCNGQRFMNESFAGLVLAQSCRQPINPEAKMVGNFAIMDSKYMSYIQAGGLDHGAPNWGFPEGIEEFQAQMPQLSGCQSFSPAIRSPRGSPKKMSR